MLIEAYVASPAQAVAAQGEGAGRIELCGPGEGGLTPSISDMRETLASVRVPVHVMVRPREGDFVYTDAEFAQMRQSVLDAKEAGAHGVVFGMLHADRTFDVARMRELIALARPMRIGVHRAFDGCADFDTGLDVLLALGVDVILAAAHETSALSGAPVLKRLTERAAGRTVIMAGGGVRAENVHAILAQSGVPEIHARATSPGIIAGLAAALRDKPR
jgi:copper homeostasis protein